MATPEFIELAGVCTSNSGGFFGKGGHGISVHHQQRRDNLRCFRGGGEFNGIGRTKKLMYQLNNSNTNEEVSLSLGNSLQEALRSCPVQLL